MAFVFLRLAYFTEQNVLKKQILKGSIWSDSEHTTFWKRQHYRESRDQWLPGVWREGGEWAKHRGVLGQRDFSL